MIENISYNETERMWGFFKSNYSVVEESNDPRCQHQSLPLILSQDEVP